MLPEKEEWWEQDDDWEASVLSKSDNKWYFNEPATKKCFRFYVMEGKYIVRSALDSEWPDKMQQKKKYLVSSPK